MEAAVVMSATAPGESLDKWYVTNGVVAVGPVSFDLLTRGVVNGRIPGNSFIRHESWRVWRRLKDINGLSVSDREETVRSLADITASAEEKASSPFHEIPPPQSGEVAIQGAPEPEPEPHVSVRPSTLRPAAVDPVGVLGEADDFEEALLLALSTAATAAGADIGLLHRRRPENGLLFTSCAHGPASEMLLGDALPEDDPAVTAGRAGRTVIGEPIPGETACAIAGRFRRCLGSVRGVAMVPVQLHGELHATIEVARISRPFRAREIARVEDVAEALVSRIVVAGWLE